MKDETIYRGGAPSVPPFARRMFMIPKWVSPVVWFCACAAGGQYAYKHEAYVVFGALIVLGVVAMVALGQRCVAPEQKS